VQLSVFLGEEKRRALSHPEADVYEAVCELFAGREVTKGQREIARRAVVDQAQVPGALRVLQQVHLIEYETSPLGTQVTILPESDEALVALRHLAQERGGAVPPSAGSERYYQQSLRALKARAASPAQPPPDEDKEMETGRWDGSPPWSGDPRRAAASRPVGGQERGLARIAGELGWLVGPASGAAPGLVEAPTSVPSAAAPEASPLLAEAGEGAASASVDPGAGSPVEGAGEGAAGGADEPPVGDDEGSSPGDDEGSSLEAGPPNYSPDQSNQIPPSLPPPASSEAVRGREEPAVAAPPPEALAADEGPGACQPPAKRPLAAAPLVLDPLVELARSLWPAMAPSPLRTWLPRVVGLVQPAASQAEMAAYLRWAAQDESLAQARFPLAAAMTAHRFVPWLESHRARQLAPRPQEAARAPFRPAATRPPQRLTAEERADNLRQCAVNVEGARRALDLLNAPTAATGSRRRP
jgi:hypothetical protein